MSKLESLQSGDSPQGSINNLDPYSFEEVVAELFAEIPQFRDVRMTSGSGDAGIDAIATEKVYMYPGKVCDYTVAIQAKHYNYTKVDGGMVRKYSELLGEFDNKKYPTVTRFDRVYIVTSGEFTEPANSMLNNRIDMFGFDSDTVSRLLSKS